MTKKVLYTTIPDFNTGVYSDTQPVAYGDGAVELVGIGITTLAFEMGGSTRGQAHPNILNLVAMSVEAGATLNQRETNQRAFTPGATTKIGPNNRYAEEQGSSNRQIPKNYT